MMGYRSFGHTKRRPSTLFIAHEADPPSIAFTVPPARTAAAGFALLV